MNLNDVMLVGTHPITLRVVLGLMEDAESSLEVYRWAATAMMHAFDTQDLELRQQINKILDEKGLKPYGQYEPEQSNQVNASAIEKRQKKTMPPAVQQMQLKLAIEALMALKDKDNKELFCQKNHWWAVYRLCVDMEVMGLKENRYKEFIELIDKLELQHINAVLDMATLSNISQDLYRYPFTKWELHKPWGDGSRKISAYQRMYEIAESFQKILEEKGF